MHCSESDSDSFGDVIMQNLASVTSTSRSAAEQQVIDYSALLSDSCSSEACNDRDAGQVPANTAPVAPEPADCPPHS
eukprot:6185791-Pleurochrysis_carterae.AAC.1